MAQILDPLPSDNIDPIFCCYVNATNQIQIVRITNIQNWYFERVVFPGQRLVFEAVPEAMLEIHTGMMASAILTDKISCDRLEIEKENDVLVPALKENAIKNIDNKTKFEVLNKKAKETLVTSIAPA